MRIISVLSPGAARKLFAEAFPGLGVGVGGWGCVFGVFVNVIVSLLRFIVQCAALAFSGGMAVQVGRAELSWRELWRRLHDFIGVSVDCTCGACTLGTLGVSGGNCTFLFMSSEALRRWLNEIPVRIYVPVDWRRVHTAESEINFVWKWCSHVLLVKQKQAVLNCIRAGWWNCWDALISAQQDGSKGSLV